MTAPAGIATTTPKTILSYASVNIDSVAMQHHQYTAGGHHLIHAGQDISLFARQGLRAIAHTGPLVLQSQGGDTQIDSAKDFKATAAGGIVYIAKEITLMTTGGAYISLKNDTVTIGGPGPLHILTDGHNWGGPATMSGDLPSFSQGDLGRTPKIISPMDGAPVEGMQLHVGRTEGGDLTGQTDVAGKGSNIVASSMQRLKSFFYIRGS